MARWLEIAKYGWQRFWLWRHKIKVLAGPEFDFDDRKLMVDLLYRIGVELKWDQDRMATFIQRSFE